MLQIYYGLGKGKSSAANGAAIRAKGAGWNVVVFRFLKGRETSEDKMLMQLGIEVNKVHYGDKFVFRMNDDEKQQTKQVINDVLNIDWSSIIKKPSLVVLDEILDLTVDNVNMLTKDELEQFLSKIKAISTEVIATGHEKCEQQFKHADLITYFKPEKHYYDDGQKAREGIEF